MNGFPIDEPTSELYSLTIEVAEGLCDKHEAADILRRLA
jgi:hypothetical protein